MGNINYFCIVKFIKNTFYKSIFCIILLIFCRLNTYGTIQNSPASDSIEISLLTCQPHQEVYSLYGHTAIRFQNFTRGTDIVINYGMFSFAKPHFILRFVFGLTDYEMGIMDIASFCDEYHSYGSGVTQQTLNLTQEEKIKIAEAIDNNYRPENRTYRYNYFFDNCTTRARDIIVNNLNGKVRYAINKSYEPSFREMIHDHNAQHPWARFGNDMLLGLKSDFKTDYTQQQFLPENLQKDFGKAVIINTDGSTRPLVKSTSVIVQPGIQIIESEFPLTPSACTIILFCLTVLVTAFEYYKKKTFWVYDMLLMTVDGLAGIIIFLMIFSQHPTVSLNLQILLLNPLPLIFLYKVIKDERKHKSNAIWAIWIVLLAAFIIGGFFQNYAEGISFVAYSLLLRCIVQTIRQRRFRLS